MSWRSDIERLDPHRSSWIHGKIRCSRKISKYWRIKRISKMAAIVSPPEESHQIDRAWCTRQARVDWQQGNNIFLYGAITHHIALLFFFLLAVILICFFRRRPIFLVFFYSVKNKQNSGCKEFLLLSSYIISAFSFFFHQILFKIYFLSALSLFAR